jgi:hypothetical protein
MTAMCATFRAVLPRQGFIVRRILFLPNGAAESAKEGS